MNYQLIFNLFVFFKQACSFYRDSLTPVQRIQAQNFTEPCPCHGNTELPLRWPRTTPSLCLGMGRDSRDQSGNLPSSWGGGLSPGGCTAGRPLAWLSESLLSPLRWNTTVTSPGPWGPSLGAREPRPGLHRHRSRSVMSDSLRPHVLQCLSAA